MATERRSNETQAGLEGQIARLKLAAWICVALGFLAAVWGFLKIGHNSQTELSALGSYLQGAVASIWSLAAFLFVYVAFLGQRQQMLRQHEEFEAQRNRFEQERAEQQRQLEIHRAQFAEQQRSINRQNFESSFFQLLNLHNQVVDSMSHSGTYLGNVNGRDCFQGLYHEFKNFSVMQKAPGGGFATKEATLSEKYVGFYAARQAKLGQYFRSLYHLVKFVKDSEIDNKARYTNLARAQLSTFELLLLFYNCISVHGEKFKPLVEEFALLKHIDFSLLLEHRHVENYRSDAFRSGVSVYG